MRRPLNWVALVVIGPVAVVGAVVGVVAFGAAQASASSAPIVIPYAKTCDEAVGHCVGTAGDGGTIEMQVTSFRATGNAAQLTATETITVGGISFTAEMNVHVSPAGFIVLNGTVTEGSFAGAQVHQRSNLVGAAADDDVVDRRAPAHAGECVSRGRLAAVPQREAEAAALAIADLTAEREQIETTLDIADAAGEFMERMTALRAAVAGEVDERRGHRRDADGAPASVRRVHAPPG